MVVATVRALRRRIGSVRNIQQITRAMQMVAAVKLRRAQSKLLAARPYAQEIDKLLRHLVAQVEPEQLVSQPLLRPRSPGCSCLVVVTADRGLCGSFNANLIRHAMQEIARRQQTDERVDLICLGRKGRDTLSRRSYSIIMQQGPLFDALTFERAAIIADQMIGHYLVNPYHRIDFLYNRFISTGKQALTMEPFLPVVPQPSQKGTVYVDYLYEPDQHTVLAALLPKHLHFQTWKVLLESNAAEQGARMVAMDSATRNAEELIDELTLSYNKARQSSITREILDIVGGAEALRG